MAFLKPTDWGKNKNVEGAGREMGLGLSLREPPKRKAASSGWVPGSGDRFGNGFHVPVTQGPGKMPHLSDGLLPTVTKGPTLRPRGAAIIKGKGE